MSYDQSPWERADEEIAQAFAAKDKEIKRLKADLDHWHHIATVENREKLADWMSQHGFATGHGDTIDDLIGELTWQIEEIRARGRTMDAESQYVEELKAEINRLTELRLHAITAKADQAILIAELCEALEYSTRFIQEHCVDGHPDSQDLIRRAKEATR